MCRCVCESVCDYGARPNHMVIRWMVEGRDAMCSLSLILSLSLSRCECTCFFVFYDVVCLLMVSSVLKICALSESMDFLTFVLTENMGEMSHFVNVFGV